MIAKEVIGCAGAREQQANIHLGHFQYWLTENERGFIPIKQRGKITQDICICSIQPEYHIHRIHE